MDTSQFKPKTVYVTYIDAPLEKVWQALIDPAFTKQYFFGFAIDVEPRAGGAFRLLAPDGSTHVSGEVLEWSPPRRLCVTWRVAGMKDFGELPECLVSYDVVQAGGSVQLTMRESHSWEVPEAILLGGQVRLAQDPVEPQEPAGDRQAVVHCDGNAGRVHGRREKGGGREAVDEGLDQGVYSETPREYLLSSAPYWISFVAAVQAFWGARGTVVLKLHFTESIK